MRSLRLTAAGCAIAGLALVGPAAAADFGTIKGRFVLDGAAPSLPPLIKAGENVKDGAVCAAEAVPNETIVVGPAGGLANVFIYAPRVDAKDVHPDLKAAPTEPVKIDQKNCVFLPHAMVIRTGQPVALLNDDAVAHNVHTFPIRGNAINILIAPNEREGVVHTMEKPEILPIPVKCDIHPWMQAYALIVDHPYAAVSDGSGEFTLEKVPAGKQTFRIWHEGAGYVERSYDVDVKAGGVTDLGDIKIPLSKLQK